MAGGVRMHNAVDAFRALFRHFPDLVCGGAPVEDVLATGLPLAFLKQVLE